MPGPPRPDDPPAPRARSGRLLAAFGGSAAPSAVCALALLLFCWPFVRQPALPIGAACAHLLGSWAVIVAALALLARARASPGGEDRDG